MRLKKLTKGISLITAVAMSSFLLAGCGGTKSEPKAGADTSASQTTAKAEDNKPLKFSLGMSNGNNEYAIKITDPSQEKWVKEFNKRFNTEMTLRLLDHKKLQENMQIMFASGDIPDVVLVYDNWARPELSGSVEAGLYMPLDDILAKNKDSFPTLMKSIPAPAWDEMKYEGKTYGIPSTYLSVSARRATYIRKDLLDKFNLKVPKTVDEYVQVLRAFKQNGVKYPYAGRDKWDYTDVFFGPFGVYKNSWNLDKNGQLVPDMITPQMKEALEFHAMLRKEGLMDPESLTTNATDWQNKIFAGNVGMFDHNANSYATYESGLKANVPTGHWVMVESPEGKGGPGGNKGMFKYSSVNQSCYINKNFKEPVKFIKLLDKMLSPESKEFFNFGIEGEDYSKKDGKLQYTYPNDKMKVAEASYRKGLGIARDEAYNKELMPFLPGGDEMINWFEKIAPKEGLGSIDPGGLKAYKDNPELRPGQCDIFYDVAAKIFFGQAAPDAFDNFVKDWTKRGGEKMIKEATEIYKAGKAYKR